VRHGHEARPRHDRGIEGRQGPFVVPAIADVDGDHVGSESAAGHDDRAQAAGHVVPLDYIFPAAGARLAADLPEYVPILDIGPEAFFEGVGTT